MTVQGGAARLLLDSDDRVAREPLLVVEETGRQALAEMRRLLGMVHSERGRDRALAPRPGMAISTDLSPERVEVSRRRFHRAADPDRREPDGGDPAAARRDPQARRE
jgi:hypothetical protein